MSMMGHPTTLCNLGTVWWFEIDAHNFWANGLLMMLRQASMSIRRVWGSTGVIGIYFRSVHCRLVLQKSALLLKYHEKRLPLRIKPIKVIQLSSRSIQSFGFSPRLVSCHCSNWRPYFKKRFLMWCLMYEWFIRVALLTRIQRNVLFWYLLAPDCIAICNE